MIDSLGHFAPIWGGNHYFPHIEPILWFDMVRVLGAQYQSRDKGKASWRPSWRPRGSLAAAGELHGKVLGESFPPLNLDLLPEYVQHAVKQFRHATEHNEHSCCDGFYRIGWKNLDVECRTRYAAAYALLYSMDLIPLIGDAKNHCDACDDIRVLYDCVHEISAGQTILGSKNIVKVLRFIKRLAVISTFSEHRSDVENIADDDFGTTQNSDDQQHDGSSEDEEAVIPDDRSNAEDSSVLTNSLCGSTT
ncbi:hypothetical protein C8R44DRAFT_786190 [Mycena epipterygia]|nr:hypothetical protein C8R44DRAFT_786190 [Mycena epipterygia]